MRADILPEVQLLLHCARTQMEPDRAELVRSLVRQDLNWVYLMEEATRHVVRPLLYHNLQALTSDFVPKGPLSNLQEYYCNNTARNFFLTDELIQLLNLLGQQQIPAIPFKGPVLAASAYGNLSLREFADLDIFVHKQDVNRIKEVLIAEGYRLLPSEEREAFYLKHKYHFPFVHSEKCMFVEIHWAFTKRYWSFDIDHESLWRRVEPVTVAGANVWNFSAEDLLLILCMHGTKHGWQRLAWICDIAELIRVHENMDWDWVFKQAKRAGGLRVLFIGLFLVRGLLDAPLPDRILAGMCSDKSSRSIASDLQTQIFSHDRKNKNALYFIHTRERMRDKTRTFLHYLRVAADLMVRSLRRKRR